MANSIQRLEGPRDANAVASCREDNQPLSLLKLCPRLFPSHSCGPGLWTVEGVGERGVVETALPPALLLRRECQGSLSELLHKGCDELWTWKALLNPRGFNISLCASEVPRAQAQL